MFHEKKMVDILTDVLIRYSANMVAIRSIEIYSTHCRSWAFVLPRLSIQMVLTAMNQPPLVGGLKLLVHPVDLLLFGEIGTVSELRSRHRFAAERVVHRSTSAQASRALVMRSSLHFRRPFAPVWSGKGITRLST